MDKSHMINIDIKEGSKIPNMFIEGEEYEPLCNHIPKIGDTLFHINYGHGVIEKVEGTPASIVATVKFQKTRARVLYGVTIVYRKIK